MLSVEEKKEKEEFFRALDVLDDSDDDNAKDPYLSSPEAHAKRPVANAAGKAPDLVPVLNQEHTSEGEKSKPRKRKPSQDASDLEEFDPPHPPPRPRSTRRPSAPNPDKQQHASSKPSLSRASTLPEKSSTTSKPPTLRRNFTDLSNLEARIKGEGKPKLRPLPKQFAAKPTSIEPDRQIFRDLVFYFVPNNDDNAVTRMQIHSAIRRGARWSHEICEEVTHIIVADNNMHVTVVEKSFASRQIPEEPVLVRMEWLLECLKVKYLQDTYWERFQVPGSKALRRTNQPEAAPPVTEGSHNPNAGGLSVMHKTTGNSTAHGIIQAAQEPVPAAQDHAATDALENAIRDVRSGATLSMSSEISDASESDDEGARGKHGTARSSRTNATTSDRTENAGFLCMESHDATSKGQNPNANTIEQLQQMATMYDRTGDQWRTKAFRQAIGKLRREGQQIRTYQEARKIGLGDSVAAAVEEIVKTGRFKRLQYAQNDPRTQIVKLFTGVYGAGETTAHKWIAQGYRSLDDLRQKADLTTNQRIGLEHYDDFQQRIPRAEVEQHGAMVEAALKAADPKFQMIIGGSYRRGSKDSGDVDCIIFMEDADIVRIRTLMLDTVIPELMIQGFLKVGLATGHSSSDDSSKWHGASALPGSKVWRRIDFLFVPWDELGAALIYFTGNDLFNRSIRFLAGKKGMRLNQRRLCKDVMRGPQRQRITDGTLVEGHDEKRIFEILGVPFRPPEERNV